MPNNILSKKLIWFVPAFAATFSFLWAVEDQGFFLVSVNLILTILIVVLMYRFFHSYIWNFEDFIVMGKNKIITIVVGAYRDTREWQQDKPVNEKERYYKTKDGRQVKLEGAHGHLNGLGTTLMVAQFVYLLRDMTDRELRVIADDEQDGDDDEGPLILFGSPRSNFKSQKYIPPIIEFVGASELKVQDHIKYVSDASKDYGVVAKNRLNARWGFVCAGIDEEGTVASSIYFLREWRTLKNYPGAFVHIISCEKNTPRSPKKVQGYFIGQDGHWQAD